jgi:hypothetical protein
MPRLARVKLGGNYAKATGSGKEANFYFPGLIPFFPLCFEIARGRSGWPICCAMKFRMDKFWSMKIS